MELFFFVAGLVALAATARVITCANPVHALLYLIVSLLAVAVDFYALGAPFAATLEVVVYAGAVMVLFVFVVMMLNLTQDTVARERHWLRAKLWVGPAIFAFVLFVCMLWAMTVGPTIGGIDGAPLSANRVGSTLFGPYVLLVELAAFLLLAALVVAAHIGREDKDSAVDRAERGRRIDARTGK